MFIIEGAVAATMDVRRPGVWSDIESRRFDARSYRAL